MYNYKKVTYYLLFFVVFISCQRQQKVHIEKDKITAFLNSCEKNIENAAKVIAEKELIKSLTHLQRMNTGGKKYYPLEREALTKMIKALSTYKYSDCFLINKYGIIIYTMYNDDIFAKSIKSFTKTPIHDLFYSGKNRKKAIADVNKLTINSTNYNIFFSTPVVVDSEIRGVFIISINIAYIKKLLPLNISITDQKGLYRLHPSENLILSENKLFSDKKMKKLFIHYNYKNLNWYLLTEKQK